MFAPLDFLLHQAFANPAPQTDVVSPPAGIAFVADAAAAAAARGFFFAFHDARARRWLQHPFRFTAVRRLRAHDGGVEIVDGRVARDVVRAAAGRTAPTDDP